MFRPSVKELSGFYNSPLGEMAALAINAQIKKLWPELFQTKSRRDQVVMGLGFTCPYLGMFLLRSQRVICGMPAIQGPSYWPPNKDHRNLSFVTEEAELPVPDLSIDRIIMVHDLEYSHDPFALLRESWRVLAPEGKLLIIVPNRQGIWARTDNTPFGHGRPFSTLQISSLLDQLMFSVRQVKTGLFVIPSQSRIALKSAKLCENIGHRIIPGFGGVLLVEAEKKIYANSRPIVENKVFAYSEVAGK